MGKDKSKVQVSIASNEWTPIFLFWSNNDDKLSRSLAGTHASDCFVRLKFQIFSSLDVWSNQNSKLYFRSVFILRISFILVFYSKLQKKKPQPKSASSSEPPSRKASLDESKKRSKKEVEKKAAAAKVKETKQEKKKVKKPPTPSDSSDSDASSSDSSSSEAPPVKQVP